MIKQGLKKRIQSLEERHGNIDKVIFEQKIKNFFKKYEVGEVKTFIALLYDKSGPNPELLQKLRKEGAHKELKEIWELGEKLTKENKL